jgi:hypothetical protein
MREKPRSSQGNYEDFGIAMFKLCVKYGMGEYSCRE